MKQGRPQQEKDKMLGQKYEKILILMAIEIKKNYAPHINFKISKFFSNLTTAPNNVTKSIDVSAQLFTFLSKNTLYWEIMKERKRIR